MFVTSLSSQCARESLKKELYRLSNKNAKNCFKALEFSLVEYINQAIWGFRVGVFVFVDVAAVFFDDIHDLYIAVEDGVGPAKAELGRVPEGFGLLPCCRVDFFEQGAVFLENIDV